MLYSVVDKRSYVIAITREGIDWKEIPLGAGALTQKVTAFRKEFDVGKARDASGKSGWFDFAPANKLYVALLGPVEALTKQAARSLHARLQQLPIAIFGAVPASIAQLPDTADELNAVAKDVGAAEADIHLGRDACETTLKRAALAQYSIICFAAHGLVAGDIKGLGEPSLALSIPDQPTELDDGLLTASEVAQLKLNADWVVLSACNTIAGDKPGAEALSGAARSFFCAGARALLVSHWGADSEAATRLTTSTIRTAQNRTKNRPCRSLAPRDVNAC